MEYSRMHRCLNCAAILMLAVEFGRVNVFVQTRF
jgi:hypothetical protein